MHAVKAIYDGTGFMTNQAIPVKGKYEVIITFLKPVEAETPVVYRPQFNYGCMSGKIWMADDFDAPLEDFAEYME